MARHDADRLTVEIVIRKVEKRSFRVFISLVFLKFIELSAREKYILLFILFNEDNIE